MNDPDTLESAFELLKARSSERAPINLDLEERLMKAHSENENPKSWSRFAIVAAGILACVVVAGVAEAATGILRSQVMRAVVTDENGNRYDVEIQLDESVEIEAGTSSVFVDDEGNQYDVELQGNEAKGTTSFQFQESN